MRLRHLLSRAHPLVLVVIVFADPDVLKRRQVPGKLGHHDHNVPSALQEPAFPSSGHSKGDESPEGDARDKARPPHDHPADPVHDYDDGGDNCQSKDKACGALVLVDGIEESIDKRVEDGEDGADGSVGEQGGFAQDELQRRTGVKKVGLDVFNHLRR